MFDLSGTGFICLERVIAMYGSNVIVTRRDFERLNELLFSPIARFYGPMTRLEEELRRSRVVSQVRIAEDVVTMNSQVRVRDIDAGKTSTYTLVYPKDAEFEDDRISVASPLGAALLGARVGDVVEFASSRGVRRMKIEALAYQPESAGDYHL
jgi:regulator of nucleoside diphosphate kinase